MVRSPILIVTACLSLAASAGPQPPGTRTDDRGRPIISVHSDLVVLHVTVIDRKKGYVASLPQNAFTVYEDGQRQPITFFRNEDAPVTVGLVIDNSGSMVAKRTGVIAAGLAFARSSNREDEMFLVNFNERVWPGLPDGMVFTSDLGVLRAALNGIHAIGKTAIYDAVAFAMDRLDRGTLQKRILIVVSDGGDNASRNTFERVLNRARATNVIVYAIGLFDRDDGDANPKVLKSLASATGGQAFFPSGAPEVVRALERIARDIRSGYTVGYVPTNTARDGKYRRILVRVRGPGHGALEVRTRPGYQGPAATTTNDRSPAGGRQP